MKITKMLGIVVATAVISSSAFAAKDLTDTWKAGVMDPYKNCVKTTGGIAACGGTPSSTGSKCVAFRGNDIESHSHPCLASGTVKVSDYKGARAKAVATLLERHRYLLR